MPRYAYQLRIREGCEAEYDRRHVAVWPELLSDLADAGVCDYSIFRRGRQLFLYLHVDNFEAFLVRMSASEANSRWQAMMTDIFEQVPDLGPGEQLAMMPEVFYMPGHPKDKE